MQRLLLINPRSGDDDPSPAELVQAAREYGVETHVLEQGDDPAALARASGAAVLGAAGGDGSLAAVASVALETDAAFVCIPFGTRNHFARDVGLDRDDPLGALAAFDDGAVERRIDVGKAGDRFFLNNVSVGVYARLVHRREHHRRRGEALARARALAQTARRPHRLHARVNGEELVTRALLVGNNRYDVDLFTLGGATDADIVLQDAGKGRNNIIVTIKGKTDRVIVIGGTGHIGTFLVPRLVTAGHEVIVASRAAREPYQSHAAWNDVEGENRPDRRRSRGFIWRAHCGARSGRSRRSYLFHARKCPAPGASPRSK